MTGNFDLLGDPIPENWGGRGRPAHIPTQENRNKVRLLLAFGWTNTRIAQALRITRGTLTKHYSTELRARWEARPALEANHLMMLYQAAAGGNVGAMKELGRQLEKLDLQRPQPPKVEEARPERLGKKAQAALEARTAHEDTEWNQLVH